MTLAYSCSVLIYLFFHWNISFFFLPIQQLENLEQKSINITQNIEDALILLEMVHSLSPCTLT